MPLSISLTNSSAFSPITLISFVCLFDVILNNLLLRVPFVAKIPIFPDFVFKDAGFIAGSTPTKGILKSNLSFFIQFVVAVLHATTISLHFF